MGVIAAAAAFAMGCGEGPESETTATVETTAVLERIEAGLQLAPAESCEDLSPTSRTCTSSSIKTPWSRDSSPMPGGIDDTGFGGEPVTNNTEWTWGRQAGVGRRGRRNCNSRTSSPRFGQGYTGTNNQETAVDEGDFVKTMALISTSCVEQSFDHNSMACR